MPLQWRGLVCSPRAETTEPIMNIDQMSEHGIRHLVDELYARARANTELAPVLIALFSCEWGLHLATMRDFPSPR